MAKPNKRRGAKKQGSKPTMAETADRHVLYEQSVQDVETEVDFLRSTYLSVRGRPAESLREDFCGTAAAACEWVRVSDRHTATGIDIDAEVLSWGRTHNVGRLSDQQKARLRLVEGDVRDAEVEPVDLLVAFNFSYWLFDTRPQMVEYLRKARAGLKDDGLFVCDAFGGSEAFDELKEETEHDDFTYVWHQAKFDPITHAMSCYIHFKFPDGSRLKRAFSYHWRLWTLPEIRELLVEAGFSNVTVYWDFSDEDDESDYVPAEKGEPDPGWIAYIVAEK
jgi:hypothetical protein